MKMLDIRDITKVYKMQGEEVRALRGISLAIDSNEYVAIMGPSGSGKSTMMNVIGCLDTPSSGKYLLEGEDVSHMNDDQLADVRNRKIGFVFQTFNLLPRSDILHNVELPLIYGNIPASRRKKMAEEAIEKVGLSDRIRHKPNELSGGQRQRVLAAPRPVRQETLVEVAPVVDHWQRRPLQKSVGSCRLRCRPQNRQQKSLPGSLHSRFRSLRLCCG